MNRPLTASEAGTSLQSYTPALTLDKNATVDIRALLLPKRSPALDAEHYSLATPPPPEGHLLRPGMTWAVITRIGQRTCTWGVGRTIALDPENPAAHRMQRALIAIHGWQAITHLEDRTLSYGDDLWSPAFFADGNGKVRDAFFLGASIVAGFRSPTPFVSSDLASEWLRTGDQRLVPPQRVHPAFADLGLMFRTTLGY